MLTSTDLTKIEEKIKKEIKPVNDRLDKVDKRFDKVDKRFNKVDKQFNKIHKDLKVIINYFDHNSTNHETRITRIEKHLGFIANPA